MNLKQFYRPDEVMEILEVEKQPFIGW